MFANARPRRHWLVVFFFLLQGIARPNQEEAPAWGCCLLLLAVEVAYNSLKNLVAPRHAVVLCAAAAEAAGLRARGLRGNRGGAVKRASQQGAPTNGHNAIVPFAHSWAPCALSGSSPRVREAVRLAVLGPPGIWIRPARKWITKYLRISYGTLTGNAPSADLQVLGTTALHRHHHRYRCPRAS